MTTHPTHKIDLQLLAQQFAQLSAFQHLAVHIHEFGNGLDTLNIWQLWQETRPINHSRLHLIAKAKQPLSSEELTHQLANNPELCNLTKLLLTQYPPTLSGVHRLIFQDERLTLDLWFGDIVDECTESALPKFITPAHNTEPLTFTVIGAGIAGLSITHALTQRGYAVTLIEQHQPLSGASGNPCALLLSKLPKLNRTSGNLQTMGALTTVRWWQNWANNVVVSQGALLDIDNDDLEKIQGYPSDMVQVVHARQASQKSGIDCANDFMFMPRSAGIDPQAIRKHVLASPLVSLIKAQAANLIKNHDESQWIVLDQNNQLIAQSSKIIIANAKDSIQLCPTLPPLTVIRGQMSWLATPKNAPQLALGYGGYAATYKDIFMLGSSFVRDDQCTDIRPSEHESNFALLKNQFPQLAEQLPPIATWQGRVSLRALPRDSMPVVGEVPQMKNVFVLTGLGSKGFSFAPLCAELLAAQMLGEPLPMTEDLVRSIRPDRFIKKERVRKPYYKPVLDN